MDPMVLQMDQTRLKIRFKRARSTVFCRNWGYTSLPSLQKIFLAKTFGGLGILENFWRIFGNDPAKRIWTLPQISPFFVWKNNIGIFVCGKNGLIYKEWRSQHSFLFVCLLISDIHTKLDFGWPSISRHTLDISLCLWLMSSSAKCDED